MKRADRTFFNRLHKLADHLDKVKVKQFDYSRWVGEDWEGKPDLSCGTSACAFGHATTMPIFRKLGLRLVYGGVGDVYRHTCFGCVL